MILKFRYLIYPNITIGTGPDLVIIIRVPKFSLFRPIISLGITFIFPSSPSFFINSGCI